MYRKNMYRNLPVIFIALIIPFGLTYFIVMSNADYLANDFETVNLNILIFRWYTIFHIIWGISAILISLFYITMIFVRGYWIYALGIPLQLAVCIVIWIFSVFNGHVIIHNTVDVQDTTTYHLIQITYNATGRLNVFTCDQSLCNVEEVAFIDSVRFYDAGMAYDESTRTFNIWADNGYEIKEIIYPLE